MRERTWSRQRAGQIRPSRIAKVTFKLVLSGLAGFGKTAGGAFLEDYEEVTD